MISSVTAKANKLRLEDFILHLLTVLPDRFEHDPKTSIDDLLPWNDVMRTQFSLG